MTLSTTSASLTEQDQQIQEAVARDEPKLRSFIRKRVLDAGDAEDILQDVFYELIQAYRLVEPAEQVTAWLYRVARNRITDLFRRQKTRNATSLSAPASPSAEPDDQQSLEDLLPSPEAGPDAVYARNLLIDALEDALAELPANQREVFLAHEVEGTSFKELSAASGTPINTLLSRKHYAVLHLRTRLQEIRKNYELD